MLTGSLPIIQCILVQLVLFPNLAGQNCPSERLQSRVIHVEQELSDSGPIRLHRVETLEDQLFVPRTDNKDIESPFNIYQVQQRRWTLVNGEVVQNVPARALSEYVAISKDGADVYHLAGSKDAERDFQRLVSVYHIPAPQNEERAQSRALFCAQVVFGIEPKTWILGAGEAKAMVAEHFFDPKAKDPLVRSNRWWTDYFHKYSKANLSVTTKSTGEGSFLTVLPLFWAPVESQTTPEIRESKIRVSSDGSCHRLLDSASDRK